MIPNGFLYSLTQTSDGGYVIGASAQIQNPFGLRVLKLPPPPSPSQIVNGIVENVQSMNLQQGIANSLDAKIQNALDSLNALNADQRSDAVNKLQAFVNSVEAQRNTKLTNEQADSLVTQAQYAISLIQG